VVRSVSVPRSPIDQHTATLGKLRGRGPPRNTMSCRAEATPGGAKHRSLCHPPRTLAMRRTVALIVATARVGTPQAVAT
jgi:hypothetical protein